MSSHVQGRRGVGLALACSLTLLALLPASAPAAPGDGTNVQADFNGDGYADLAVGVPYENGGANNGQGVVQLIFGSAQGLGGGSTQEISQDSPGVEDSSEAGDWFGYAVAAGDFNGDGFSDLVVGTPNEDQGTNRHENSGVADVFYGAAEGLQTENSTHLIQGIAGLPDHPEAGDLFGWYAVAADLNGDGTDDVVVSAQGEDVPFPAWPAVSSTNTGVVQALYGSPQGIQTQGGTYLSEASAPLSQSLINWSQFGFAMTAGDFDNDGFADLAVGASGRRVGFHAQAGTAYVIYGSAGGLDPSRGQVWTQNVPGVENQSNSRDQFGRGLASGDFDGDGRADLVIGVPGESLGTAICDWPLAADTAAPDPNPSQSKCVGAAHVLYGSQSGLTAANSDFLIQGQNGLGTDWHRYDYLAFTWTISSGDFNADGRDELALGAFAKNLGNLVDAGALYLVPGANQGLAVAETRMLTQNDGFTGDQAEHYETLSMSVSSGDFDGDGIDDLVAGVFGEDLSTPPSIDAGAIQLLYGAPSGPTPLYAPFLTQSLLPGLGPSETADYFGAPLASAHM